MHGNIFRDQLIKELEKLENIPPEQLSKKVVITMSDFASNAIDLIKVICETVHEDKMIDDRLAKSYALTMIKHIDLVKKDIVERFNFSEENLQEEEYSSATVLQELNKRKEAIGELKQKGNFPDILLADIQEKIYKYYVPVIFKYLEDDKYDSPTAVGAIVRFHLTEISHLFTLLSGDEDQLKNAFDIFRGHTNTYEKASIEALSMHQAHVKKNIDELTKMTNEDQGENKDMDVISKMILDASGKVGKKQ